MHVERVIGWLETAPVDQKAAASDALARAFLHSEMSESDREIAEATITVMLDDPNLSVRAGLSKALASSPYTPRHIVLALANDEPAISLPVLAASPLLLCGEMIAIVTSGTSDQQIAIAGRSNVSIEITNALASNASYEACLTMLLNPGASITKTGFLNLAERYGDIPDMRKCLLVRPDVPVNARILLIEKYAISLLGTHDDEDEKQREKRRLELQAACDKAIITFAAQVGEQELHDIVKCLIDTSRLTTEFLLRAICMGNISLFSHTLSVLGEVPLARVERVLADNRRKAFIAIYQRAEMPASAMNVFSEAVSCWRELLSLDIEIDPVRLPYLVTKQVLAQYHGEATKEVDELLLLLRNICSEAARDNARETMQRVSAQINEQERLQLDADKLAEEKAQKLSDEEFMEFAVNLADELAEDAVRQENANRDAQKSLDPANNDARDFVKAA